jgi:hypothetical protein
MNGGRGERLALSLFIAADMLEHGGDRTIFCKSCRNLELSYFPTVGNAACKLKRSA